MRVRMEPTSSVKPHPSNPRRNHDVEGIARSIQAFGWRNPIVVWEGDGHVLAGHGRLLAAHHLGLDKVPVHHVKREELSAEQAVAYRLADNRTAESSEWDDVLLLRELQLLDERQREEAGFTEAYLDELRRRVALDFVPDDREPMDESEARVTLAERFGAPPFSVLDARQGWWQDRKRAWIALGIQSELGRGEAANDRSASTSARINDAADGQKRYRKPNAIPGGGPMPGDRIAGPTDQTARRRKLSPGGAPMPAADYSKSKARGDGRGRAMRDG